MKLYYLVLVLTFLALGAGLWVTDMPLLFLTCTVILIGGPAAAAVTAAIVKSSLIGYLPKCLQRDYYLKWNYDTTAYCKKMAVPLLGFLEFQADNYFEAGGLRTVRKEFNLRWALLTERHQQHVTAALCSYAYGNVQKPDTMVMSASALKIANDVEVVGLDPQRN
jgi:hypothetical protein